jgi:hypothetical protein
MRIGSPDQATASLCRPGAAVVVQHGMPEDHAAHAVASVPTWSAPGHRRAGIELTFFLAGAAAPAGVRNARPCRGHARAAPAFGGFRRGRLVCPAAAGHLARVRDPLPVALPECCLVIPGRPVGLRRPVHNLEIGKTIPHL